MKINKFTAAVCAASLTVSGTLFYCYDYSGSAVSADTDEIKILCIGDSITDGYGTEGSYRKFLYKELADAGYRTDMTGPNFSWGDAKYSDPDSGETFTYDPAHCGYSGYAIEAYPGRNGIRETITDGNYLKEYEPDIVILQIGTNDIIDNHEINSAGERLDTLVTYILDNISEDSALFVTTVPDLEPNREDVYPWFANYRHSADWQIQYSDEEAAAAVNSQIVSYNSQVLKVVSDKQKNGAENIYFGDVHSAVTDTSKQLKDGVHPNDTGYKAMGEYWAGIILDYLKGDISAGPGADVPPSEEPPADNPPTDNPPSGDNPPADDNPHDKSDNVQGDINGDDAVNTADFILLQKYLLGINEGEKITAENSDLSENGKIDIADFILLKKMLIEN